MIPGSITRSPFLMWAAAAMSTSALVAAFPVSSSSPLFPRRLERAKSNLMPPWGNTLNERQVRYLVAYVRTLGQPK
jgi:hypothetical protein